MHFLLATGLVAGAVTPLLGPQSPLGFAYDFVVFAYVLALGFLLVRPQGLFGEKIIDRV